MLAVTASCSSPRPSTPLSEAEAELLASDAYIRVGEVTLALPFVALTGYTTSKPSFSFDRSGDRRRDRERVAAFRASAGRAQTAPISDKVEVSIHTYGWNDFRRGYDRICPRLKQSWAASVCDDPWAPLERAMPVNPFHLADMRKPEAFDNVGTVGGERKGDQLRAARLRVGKVSVVCDVERPSETRFCTAALPITASLGAVWTVWDSRDVSETAHQQADREGKAIAAWLQEVLGPSRSGSNLARIFCPLRRPGSSEFPSKEVCSGSDRRR